VNERVSSNRGAACRACPGHIRVAVSIAALALLARPAAFAQASEVVARAAGVTGQATLTSPGAVPLALAPGFILSPGDRIDTRGGGRVVIDLSDGSMVVISPGSVVTIKDFHAAGSLRELFEITLGMVRVKINHFAGKPNPYRMNSPTASIAVRGTEFTIEVDSSGATQVTVIEGSVEVSSLTDPARSVILQAGQSYRLVAGNFGPPPGNRGDDRHGDPPPPPNNMAQAAPPPPGQPSQQLPPPNQQGKAMVAHNDHDSDQTSPRANAGTYDRYLASLSDIGQMPFLLRYNAFAEDHLDSLENPAYATVFRSAEGRLYFLPTFNGGQSLAESQAPFSVGSGLPGNYSISPQVSYFAPAGGFVFGGSAGLSRVGSSPADGSPGNSGSTFYSGSVVAARRFGANSFGLEVSTLKGTGSTTTPGATPGPWPGSAANLLTSATSDVTQTRFTAGYSRDLAHRAKFGIYYRYGFIDAKDRDPANATLTSGHSSELGVRLRGALTSRLSYGLTASWLGVSLVDGLSRTGLVDSHERDRAHRAAAAVGLGYSLTRRTLLTFDLAGGASHNSALRHEDTTGLLLQDSGGSARFVSAHIAVQRDLTRRLFLTATFLHLWQWSDLGVALYPDRYGYVTEVSDSFFPLTPIANAASRFSDFGAGWRFNPNLFLQYLYTTDYGVTAGTHTLMLRYTFGKER